MANETREPLVVRWFGDESPEAHALRLDQVAVLARGTPTMALGNLFNSAIFAVVVHGVVDPRLLGAWMALIWLAAAQRLWRWWRNRSAAPRTRVRTRTLLRSVIWSGIAGALWGVAGIAGIPLLPVTYQVLIAFVIGGQAAAAATWLSPLLPACMAYILASMVPLIVGFAVTGTTLGHAMAAMLLAYLLVQLHFGLQGSRTFREHTKAVRDRERLLQVQRRSQEDLERLIAERTAELRESRNRLLKIADNLPIVITHVDAQWRVQFVNREMMRWYARPREEIVGEHISDVLGQQQQRMSPYQAQAMAGNLAKFEGLRRYPDGVRRHVETTYIPDRGEEGSLGGYFVMSLDVSERVRHTDARLASERLLQTVIDTVPHLIYVMDAEGRFRVTNRSFTAFCGVQRDDLLGRGVLELPIPHDEATEVHALADREVLETGRTVEVAELAMTDAQGRAVVHHVHKLPLYDPEGQISGLVGISEDVTAQVAMAAQLRESESRNRAILDALPDLLFVASADFRILDYQAHGGEKLYDQAGDFIGRPVREVLPPHVATPIEASIVRALESGATQSLEYDLPTPAGLLSFEARIGPLEGDRVVAVVRDVTDRKRAEAALRQSEELARSIIDNSPSMFALKDLQGHFLMVNRQYEKTYGVRAQDVVGKTSHDLNSKQIADLVSAHDRAVIETEHAIEQWREVPFGDDVRSLMTIKFPVKSAEGRIVAIGTIATDVTEQRSIEEQLRQAQKMEAVGQLAGGVAHDFNNLLQIISGYTQIALRRRGTDDALKRDLLQVGKATQRATELVRNLLGFSRRQNLQLREVQLDTLIEEHTRVVRRLIGEHIHMQFISEAALATVNADPGAIEQVMLNLCINARDAMPDGGALMVSLNNFAADEAFCQSNTWAKAGVYLRIDVTDTGSGIPTEIQHRIFEPFMTTKEVGRGTGLGLSVAYGIIQQLGGHISFHSEPGQGTTFSVFLPVSQADSAEAPAHAETPQPRGGGETILLAEDDENVRTLVTELLEQNGYSVRAAPDGREALRMFEENPDAIDLAILDVVMPVMGGRDTYLQVRIIRPSLPVLFATGYDAGRIDQEILADRLVGLIEKPFQSDSLYRAVRQVLAAAKSG